MKKNIGSVMGLYPSIVTIIGIKDGDKVNWINIAHVGIIGHDTMLLSMNKAHYSNDLIKENGKLTINLVNEAMMVKADYVGMTSGKQTDKSKVFDYTIGSSGAPIIDESPLTMECEVVEIIDTGHHDNFIVRSLATHVAEDCLNDKGKIDYEKVRPLLFEMPNRQYLSIGKSVGSCWHIGRNYQEK
ncbi:flavin reductase family protein [Acidaminobacter sp. JC074]|uniref:flavin reductase family protein n=1 Tax=Acidaminobacter sp. JC074 TaxID=2530199 RepID=UPI001F0D0B0A|nr:flavin reductase family protein [Acidaminobacter sp. JC074]MCH4889240.1 flavin reductase family protein [Acidaminobacter sp. JC074]